MLCVFEKKSPAPEDYKLQKHRVHMPRRQQIKAALSLPAGAAKDALPKTTG
jgi:hypothetical protein